MKEFHLLMQRERGRERVPGHPYTHPYAITFPTTFNLISESIHFLSFLANWLPIISTFPTICTLFRNVWKTSPLSAVERWGAQGILHEVPSTATLGSTFLWHNHVVRDSSGTGFINVVLWMNFRVSLRFLALYGQFCICTVLDGGLKSDR